MSIGGAGLQTLEGNLSWYITRTTEFLQGWHTLQRKAGCPAELRKTVELLKVSRGSEFRVSRFRALGREGEGEREIGRERERNPKPS